MQYFLISLGTIVLFLLVLLFLTGGKLSNLIGFFVEELDENNNPLHPVKLAVALPQSAPKTTDEPAPVQKSAPTSQPAQKKAPRQSAPQRSRQAAPKQSARRNPNQVYNEMAILTHKIDERRRVVDSNGHSTLYDEYFELVFETRRGETIRLVSSRAAFKETPFNQDGALTYKKGRFVRFKYQGGVVTDEIPRSQRQ